MRFAQDCACGYYRLGTCGKMDIASKEANNDPEACKTRRQKKRRGRRLTGISKQRRQANKRERNRVHELNATIERLRELIPLFPYEKKPSKTETIRLAALYICHMTELLQTTAESEHDADNCRELSFITLNQSFQEYDTGLDAEELVKLYWNESEELDI